VAISLIKYQALNFTLSTDVGKEDCLCTPKRYCQKVNKFDIQKFQINSTTIVDNGDFGNGNTGWVIRENIIATITAVNESAEGECDGEITITPINGTGPYEYSIDGGAFVSTNVYEGLCVGCYSIVIKDSIGNVGIYNACIDTNVDCSLYDEPDLFDLSTLDLSKIINCELNDVL
jgi:hypothetical protein